MKKFKKLKKFLRDPNLFFYDMFRKRVNNKISTHITNEGTRLVNHYNYSDDTVIDAEALNQLGFKRYVIDKLHTGIGARDGRDSNGLILWSEQLYLFFSVLTYYCKVTATQVDIFTTNGESFSTRLGRKLDAAHLLALFCKRVNFIIELSQPASAPEVLNIHLFDINEVGIATVRSNKAWMKKFPAEEVSSFYSGQRTSGLKVDAVYTWVNQSNPEWQKIWIQTFPDAPYDKDRYTDNNELKYSLRSLSKYAPWINRIFIVSNCTKPDWLVLDDRIRWVDHHEIFPDPEALPTFNSHAIECCLHRIPHLQENFIYFNDDFFLSHPCLQSDFFSDCGRSISYLEPYGMVSHLSNDQAPDYLVAAKNSSRLLKRLFPTYEARQLHKHVPYALKKSTLLEIENQYLGAFTTTRNSRIRGVSDINVTSFLYHHYAIAQGSAVFGDTSSYIVRPTNIIKIVNQDTYKYKILCFNDGNGSSSDHEYKKLSTSYFKFRYHQKAYWEADFLELSLITNPTL